MFENISKELANQIRRITGKRRRTIEWSSGDCGEEIFLNNKTRLLNTKKKNLSRASNSKWEETTTTEKKRSKEGIYKKNLIAEREMDHQIYLKNNETRRNSRKVKEKGHLDDMIPKNRRRKKEQGKNFNIFLFFRASQRMPALHSHQLRHLRPQLAHFRWDVWFQTWFWSHRCDKRKLCFTIINWVLITLILSLPCLEFKV